MNTEHSISSRILALIFIGLLAFPLAVQTAHGMGNHEHEACNDLSIHFHEYAPDCELDDIRLTSFDQVSFVEILSPLRVNVVDQPIFWQSNYAQTNYNTALGRAPPTR